MSNFLDRKDLQGAFILIVSWVSETNRIMNATFPRIDTRSKYPNICNKNMLLGKIHIRRLVKYAKK